MLAGNVVLGCSPSPSSGRMFCASLSVMLLSMCCCSWPSDCLSLSPSDSGVESRVSSRLTSLSLHFQLLFLSFSCPVLARSSMCRVRLVCRVTRMTRNSPIFLRSLCFPFLFLFPIFSFPLLSFFFLPSFQRLCVCCCCWPCPVLATPCFTDDCFSSPSFRCLRFVSQTFRTM